MRISSNISPATQTQTKQAQAAQAPVKTGFAEKTVPFISAEEAWFWFVRSQEARNDGARFVAGLGLFPRPCEPLDILKAVDRLTRQRRLLLDHLLVLRHYGRRSMAPDPRRVKEARAHRLWKEALERLEAVLERKNIVVRPAPVFASADPDAWAMAE